MQTYSIGSGFVVMLKNRFDMRMQKESVIEREIRLAREREEAYRREKGLAHVPLVASSSNSSTNEKVANRRNTTTAVVSPSNASNGSPRDVQHRMATSRIQQEIEETSQREKELRAAGKIYTTSEETVDAKLTRGFEEKYILFERPVKARRKKYSQAPQNVGEAKKVAVVRREQEARLQQAQNQQQKSQQQQYRRSYCTAEEKIQEELRDMQQREEELRRHRARQLGRSQPNLAGLILEDEDDVVDSKGMNGHAHLHNGETQEVNGIRSALSNPNLLDDEQEHTQAPVERGARRRSALIAQWENRIHQTAAT